MKNIILFFALLSFTYTTNAQSVADDFYKQAKQYSSVGDVAKAVEYYSKTIEADPKFLNAYFNRGSILAQQNKYQEALNDFINFNKISPNDYEVEYLMAACHYYLGDKNISFELVNKALKNKQDFFDALKLRGTIYLEKGEHTKAIDDLNRASLIRTNDYDLYYMSGFCYEALNDSTNALKNYLKAEELGYNKDAAVFNNIGNLLSKQGDYNKALIYFGNAIAINNNFALAFYNQGIAYDRLGFRDNALKSWRKAKELGFTNFSAPISEILNKN